MPRRKPFAFLILLLAAAHLSAGPPTRRSREKAPAPVAASSEVQKALEAELAGDNGVRNSILATRLASDPEDVAARWHSGQIRVDGQWLPYAQVADHGDRWRELYRYREERAKKSDSLDDQLFLADGSRHHKLFDEERAHLMQVVAFDPSHTEAHTRLGDVPVQGTWIAREAAQRTVRNARRGQAGYERYGAKAAKFVQRLRQRSPSGLAPELSRFDEWLDPEALPSLEQAVGDQGDAVHEAYLGWLDRFPCYEASQAIVRQALFSEHAPIRVTAVESLKSRPTADYMRDLVASVTVLRPASEPRTITGRGLHLASYTVDSMSRRLDVQFLLKNPIEVFRAAPGAPAGGWTDRHEATGAAAAQIWQADGLTRAARDQVRSDRAARIVAEISGERLKDAESVWEWWGRANDMNEAKEIVSIDYEQPWYVDRRTRRVQPQAYQSFQYAQAMSCLTAGTPLVTETGPRPIEEIGIGDRVLAQDPETGELAFKPVVARMSREKAKLTRLKTADDEIVCSQGHPYWVNAMGWVQARHLRPGLPLHTVQGSLDVVSVEPAGTGTVYNVIVADSHSYFVGKTSAVLSHDISPRDPTNAIVPGLQPLWLTPERSEDETPVTVR